MDEHFDIVRRFFGQVICGDTNPDVPEDLKMMLEAQKSFNRIAEFYEHLPVGGEIHKEVLASVLSKAEDLPHHKDFKNVCVVVLNADDVKGIDPERIDLNDYAAIKIKPNATVIGFATPYGRSAMSLLTQSTKIRAMFCFQAMIGEWGVGWFAEIFNRLSPLSWRVWKPEKKAKV